MLHDFSEVRVHEGNEAARMSRMLGAKAFTHGRDVFFGEGQYDPHTIDGKRLLAHELTHVHQQTQLPGVRQLSIQKQDEEAQRAASPGPRNLQVPWRGSVLLSLVHYFAPLTSVADTELIGAIEAALSAASEGFYFSLSDEQTGKRVRYEQLGRQRFEQLMREHERDSFMVKADLADRLLTGLGMSWATFEILNENRGPFEALEEMSREIRENRQPVELPPFGQEESEPNIEFPEQASTEDIALVRHFIGEIFSGSPPVRPENGDTLSISMDEIEAVRGFYEEPEASRQELIELLRPSDGGERDDSPEGLDALIEIARAHRRIKQTVKVFSEELDEAGPAQQPIVHRPIRGEVVTPDQSITTDMEARFVFQLKDEVDAFRVPHVSIRWQAIRRKEDGTVERIESDTTNYIEVREHGLLNEKIFEVTFEQAGTYEVHAIVNHNFYLPNAFQKQVVVKPPTTVVDELRAEGGEDFGTLGTRPGEANYDFEGLSDIGDYDEGFHYSGQLSEERFTADTGSFGDSYAAIDADIATLEGLVDHYRRVERAEHQDNQDLINWAEGRLGRLRETRRQLESYERGENSLPIAIQGYYASQTSGVGHHRLDLVAWFDYVPRENDSDLYAGHLLDHTGVTGPENLHFSETAGSYEAMIEALFLELSEDYPSGYISVSFQIYDRSERTRRLVTFERQTETLSSDIAETAFSAPVSIAVNATAAVLTVFPPTTGLGIALGLSYNSAATAYDISEAIESDTLRGSHAIDVGLVFLDVLPVIGKGIRGFTTAGRAVRTVDTAAGTYKALRVAGQVSEYTGEFYLFSAEAERQIRHLHDQQIVELAGVVQRIQELQAQGAPPSILAVEQQRARRLQRQIRETLADTLTNLAATQALSLATPAAVSRLASSGARTRTGDSPPSRLDVEPELTTPRHPDPEPAGELPHSRPEAEPSEQAPRRVDVPEAETTDPSELPDRLVSAGRLVPVRRNQELPNHEVRVNYETDHRGLITRIWVEAGRDAKRLHVEQHAVTVRLMQRYQGVSGRLRVFLTRMQNIIGRYTEVVGHVPLPGSRAFEAEAEIEKLPPIIRQRAEQLSDPNLTALQRADIMAEIDQLEADLQRYMDTFERMDLEIGAGYVAARAEPRSNQAALDAGYPSLDEAPGHYYARSPTGGFHLRRFVSSDDPPKQIVWENGQPVVRNRKEGSTTYEPPETLHPGETRTYTGPRGTTATATRRQHDRAVVIRSEVGPGRGRLGYEKALLSGVEVGLEGWHRAHSQGQGTGHESPYGILYAPEEVNLEYQNAGIEQHIRDLFTQIDSDVTLYLTTETIAHPGTRRLQSITYKIEAERADGSIVRLYEVDIRVQDSRDNPDVGISTREFADFEDFLTGTPGRQPGTEPPETRTARTEPMEVESLPPRAAGAIDALEDALQQLEDRPDLSTYRDELYRERSRLLENPTEANIDNVYDTLEAIEHALGS